MSVINATPLLAAAGGDYQISRSVRLRSSASAYFNRTPASAGNRQIMTFSWGMKLGNTAGAVFGAPSTTNPRMQIYYNGPSDGRFELYQSDGGGSQVCYTLTSARYRDPSAWYHFIIAIDTTQATAANRIKWYVNGVQLTAFDTAAYPAQNTNMEWNAAAIHNIGRQPNGGSYFDGYLTEINFIDGQALTPSSFGETDAVTGVWKPKKYAGTYGTNGFYLNFSDSSAATAAAIGKDSSGNGNNWTPNNISVTAGATYDSMLDVPTMYADGGNGRGNYPTLNPLFNTGILGYLPLTNANLTATDTSGSAAWRSRWATIGMSSGKWYAEFPITYSGSASVSSAGAIGIGLHDGGSSATYVGQTSTTYGYLANAVRYNNASSVSYGATFANGDVIGVAYDADAGTLTFYKNGVSQGVAYSSIPAGTYFFAVSVFWVSPDGNTTINANFGQRPFAYTPPTGFKALNTQNLPDSTIKAGNKYFDVVLRTGTTATYTKTGLGFQPDLAWTKLRSTAYNHLIQDSVRGVAKQLNSDTTSAEQSISNAYTSFNSDGYTLGINTGVNESPYTYVDWLWKESVSAGFDIVTYTGTGVARTVSHSLGVTPSMIIVKDRTTGGTSWQVYHRSLGNTDAVLLNSTGATFASSSYWNNTSPTSSVFTVGTSSFANTNTEAYVAYLFSEVAGYSKFGSYTGNGSADGPFVYCGFRPRYILVKCSSGVESWYTFDSARDIYNVTGNLLVPNQSLAESTFSSFDLLSNGFKIRTTNSLNNTNGATYIYAAFAENPFKNSLAR